MKKSLSLLIIALTFVSCKSHSPQVTIYAGTGVAGAANGKTTEAAFSGLMGLAIDTNGNIFVADSRNNMIREISADGTVSTLAGNGKQGSVDGKASSASFFSPAGIAAGPDGSVFYVADTQNSLVRKISREGVVTTVAGALTSSTKNHPESLARLDNPWGIVVGKDGTVYFTDWERNLIRKIGPDGEVSIIAGDTDSGAKDGKGRSASFFLPQGIAIDDKGTLYITDTYNNIIRKMDTSGMVTTLAGKPAPKGKRNIGHNDGKGPAASFNHPCGIAVDKKGIVYVADVGNNKIRKITPDGTVTTLAGSGSPGAQNGSLDKASFYRPYGVAVDKNGDLYIADYMNNTVRKISF
ncbi:MAG TPA: NHL repeat-containing protein [Mucilaginibacter sp.]|jgi:sugar lactone lactonase YvrE|nr:NHL repeat-containing protein [Mucilaginibacter sp.]